MSVQTVEPSEALAFAPGVQMLRALRAREISALELVDLHIRRIERHNPALNALVTLDFDRARTAARTADAERAAGRDRPLLGLPITVKDNLDVAGLRTTSGIAARSAIDVANLDATSVARLRAAGAVILGKTNLPPAASDWQTTNPIFGRTNNPHDLTRTPGGSTGGGAVAVAAGLSAIEIGTDIGGSIRVPAAYCGVFGHKPSETLIPRDGQRSDFIVPNPAKIGNVQGPLARDPSDLELAIDVMAGPAAGEDVAWRLDLRPARQESLAGLRVAMLPPIPWLALSAEISTALETLSVGLSRLGARVAIAQPAALGDMKDAYLRYLAMAGATLSTAVPLERIEDMARRAATSPDELGSGLFAGMRASARDYLSWVDDRERYRASYREFFTDWDVLVAPASPVTAFPHDERPINDRTINVDGTAVPYGRLGVYPSIPSLVGHPATVFPIGRDRDGLPIGAQAIGPYLEDRTPLRFALLVAAAMGGYCVPTNFASV